MRPDPRIGFIDILNRIGLIGGLRRLAGNRAGMVLALHRVLPRDERSLCFDPNIVITEAAFISLLRLLERHYEVVPLDDLLASPRGFGDRPRVALTFDDGWEDTYRIAFPHLLARQMPATIFLCTGLIDSTQALPEERFARLWSECAAHRTLDELIKDLNQWGLGKRRAHAVRPRRRQWAQEIDRMPLMGRLPLLEHLERRYRVPTANSRRFLTWGEIGIMMRTGLIRAGSHTNRHAILPVESDSEIRREVEDSRNAIWQHTGTVPEILSYPNGMYNRRVLELVRSLGIRLALTGDPGLITPHTNRWSIPRIVLRHLVSDQSTRHRTALSAGGALGHFLSCWLGSPVTAPNRFDPATLL
jgi:peptidoglycan/xylan/chitin deacetylase (PgdA/CDA1 family)